MTLTQLRYIIAIAECGSIGAAARDLFVSQSSLSAALKDVETETGIEVFLRSSKGVTLTLDGQELLGYARQVIEQADLMERRYGQVAKTSTHQLSVATQHYTFSVEAFVALVAELADPTYNFTLRETRTHEIIDDVREFRSDIGILYRSNYNARVLDVAFQDSSLEFHPLFKTKVHVFVGENHPLAKQEIVKPDDLEPFPRLSFEQGQVNSFYYSEEPLPDLPHDKCIDIADRGTLANLLTHTQGYTLSTGVLSSEMQSGIVSIPLDSDEVMEVGYIVNAERPMTPLAELYVEKLKAVVSDYSNGSDLQPQDLNK